ncbi:fimbrial biogenesis outer membrane usher protein [Caballeronia calidae]|uniref:Fimbrial biogenesis outer membrane usher protein n=1 Tax=Caballeronia calidae TaxID=1777139 RepID=A0A158E2Z4_9BURK|nr:fimbria/pilus outer membrane usher protein [Caballeronia calidae]SAL01133.1 fimbrial biogenesis outer membrane usher protein [Caballeronia calidae]
MATSALDARDAPRAGARARLGRTLRNGILLMAMSEAAIAQVDITGGSPAALPSLGGAPGVAPPDEPRESIQRLVLEIVVNQTSLGEPSDFELRHGQLYAEPHTLEAAGIRVNDLKPDADGWLALASIPGLHATYSSARQQAILDVTQARQTVRQIGYTLPPTPKATPGTGFVLNYDVAYTRQYGDEHEDNLGVWSEQRLFTPFGVFDNTGTYLNAGGDSNRYTRLDTNWTFSNPARLFTLTVGDAISSSLPWSRSVRFGGVQIQRDFSLRPDLITFPLPMFTGSAAVPSAVDLYINGLRQYSGEVAPGPFQIAQAPSLTGAGVAQVVVTDALGRRVTTSVPLYINATLLSKGLLNYSAEAGFLRDDYTLRSFVYESSPVYSGTLSYGVADWLTLQAHTEGGQGLANAGAGAVIGLSHYGAISLASAGSRIGGMTGALLSGGYQYIGPRFSFSMQATHASDGYRDVAALSGTSLFQHVYQVTTSVAILRAQSATVSYIDSEDSFSGHARVVTLAYNAQFGKRWSLFATVYRDFLQKDVWGGSIGITLALGHDISVSKTVAQSGGQTTLDLTASRPADFSGGWGWSVQAGAGADYRHAFAGANYRTSFGEFQATAQRFNGTTTGTAEATGAFAIMDGTVLPSRTITDGFALVSTDGVANVPVSQENRPVGATNARGYLLVPDLTSYQRNQIAIDPLALPADARIDTTRLNVAPERRSGVLAHFGMSRYLGASVSFVDSQGAPLPPGAVATHATTGETAVLGYDGVAFFSQLNPSNDVRIRGRGTDCSARVPFDPASARDLPQIGPFVCATTPRQQDDK